MLKLGYHLSFACSVIFSHVVSQTFLIAWNTSWPTQKHFCMTCTRKQTFYRYDCYKDVSLPVRSQNNFMFIMGIHNITTSHSCHVFSHVSEYTGRHIKLSFTVYVCWNCDISLMMFLRALGMLIKEHPLKWGGNILMGTKDRQLRAKILCCREGSLWEQK